MVGVSGSFGPLGIVGIVGKDCDSSIVITNDKLSYFVGIPGESVSWSIEGDDNLFAFLSSFGRDSIF